MEDNFKNNSKTAKDFANSLQHFIDVIIFFPYLFTASEENKEKMDKLFKLIKKKKRQLLSVSSGNLILIDETEKLIESIINYQIFKNENSNLESTILEVRGSMLKNSVTQTVYYNYLGLYYNAKANSIIREYRLLFH